MEAMTFQNTLRQCLSQICTRTGGAFYIDYEKKLHYFSAEENAAGFSLSDAPDFSSSFPYGGFRKVEDGTRLANRVYVVGDGVANWVGEGNYQKIVWDYRITTQQGITDRGNAITGRYESAQEEYRLVMWHDGLRAGMDITVVNATWGVDTALTVRHLRMTPRSADGSEREYYLELGDLYGGAAAAARAAEDLWVGEIDKIGGTVYDVDAPSAPDLQGGNLTTGVTIDADGHQVVWLQVTWGSVSDADLDHYQVQVSTSSDFSGYAQTREHPADGDRIERFVGLPGSTTYYVRVRAVDWVGNCSAWSTTRNTATAADSEAPANPAGVTGAATPVSCHVYWTANSEADLSHYVIQRKAVGGNYATIATASLNFFIDNTVTMGTSYLYQVAAVDTSGNASSYVEIGGAITPDAISGDYTDLTIQGWGHDLAFSATDHDTVAWASGTITMGDGSTTYSIDAGNTGNMGATTYVYLDTGVSETVLQTTTTAGTAVGASKLLIAAAENVSFGLAIFQVFGGAGVGVVIDNDRAALSLQGWGHDLAFSATDHDTVAWAGGTITMADGTTTYSIDAGNTGNMAATTYIYLDTDVSETVLQVTNTAATAVGNNKILVAVAKNAASGRNAQYQAFGGAGDLALITAGEIAANIVTANEILGNTITAAEIAADTITASEIHADAITASELAANAVTTSHILANTILAEDIAANVITANEILGNTITAAQIAAATITASEIAGNTIAAAQIAANTITAAEIAASTITATEMNVSQLSAIAADLGTITAGVITGATIRTAASGARVQLDSTDGIIVYNASAEEVFRVQTTGAGQIGKTGLDPIVWNAAGQVDKLHANQLDMGGMVFSAADGLLLLGPNCPITPTSWTSLRKQVATIAGAFHQGQGRWQGTRGLVVEEATENKCINPSFEVNVTDGWSVLWVDRSRVTTDGIAGSACCEIEKNAGQASAYMSMTHTITGASTGRIFAAQVWAKAATGDDIGHLFSLVLREEGGAAGGADIAQTSVTLTGAWQYMEAVGAIAENDRTSVKVVLYPNLSDNIIGDGVLVDAFQLEEQPQCTSYVDGSLGWGTWAGDAHNSRSTRAATQVNLDPYVKLFNANTTWSIQMTVQVPYDHDATWQGNSNYLFFLWQDGASYVHAVYRADLNTLYVTFLEGGVPKYLTWSADFTAGDWLDIVITVDYGGNAKLYVDGSCKDTEDISAYTALASLTEWNFGTNQTGGAVGGFVFAQCALFDRVLTPAEVAQMHALQRPLVDAGAMDRPGIYVLDGQFKMQSSTTGNRIVIDADRIAGYDDSDVLQFYLDAADGKAYAGAGTIELDADGITIESTDSEIFTSNAVKFELSDVSYGSLSSWHGASDHEIAVRAEAVAGKNSTLSMLAQYSDTGVLFADIELWCSRDDDTYPAGIGIRSRNEGTQRVLLSPFFEIPDGVAAPDATVGYAKVYVDTADGDLKVKFGDGHVAVIAADS